MALESVVYGKYTSQSDVYVELHFASVQRSVHINLPLVISFEVSFKSLQRSCQLTNGLRVPFHWERFEKFLSTFEAADSRRVFF